MRPLQCHGCRHFEWGWVDSDRCAAFPDGIPTPIWSGEADHSAPYPGDDGVRRAPRDPKDDQARDVRHFVFRARTIEPLPHHEDPLGALVLTGGDVDPEILVDAWRTTRDAVAMFHVLLRARRITGLVRAIALTSQQLELEGCDFLDDKGWLAVSLQLGAFQDELAFENLQNAWKAFSTPFEHTYLTARVQHTLLRNMRRMVPAPPPPAEWTAELGSLAEVETALCIAPATPRLTIADVKFVPPWTRVANAAGVEAELARELAPGHRLHGRKKLRAVARRSDGEEVLFVDDDLAAVVHLTWKKDVTPPEPKTEIYFSLEEFVTRRMTPDHGDFTGAEPRIFAFSFRSTLSLDDMLERLPERERWEWDIRQSSWYGEYIWAKHGSTRFRIFHDENDGLYTIQADLVDRADEGDGWFVMTRAVTTKSFLPSVDAKDVAACMPQYD